MAQPSVVDSREMPAAHCLPRDLIRRDRQIYEVVSVTITHGAPVALGIWRQVGGVRQGALQTVSLAADEIVQRVSP